MVLTLAEQLGCDPDIAITVMADNIVPDIGSLKKYPEIHLKGRWVDFTNTMSANERAGFLAGFERLAYHRWEEQSRMADQVILLVNNRADRPPRSHVFAKVVTEDTPINGVIVIGTAVKDFRLLLDYYQGEYLKQLGQPAGKEPNLCQQWLANVFRPLRRRPQDMHLWPETFAHWLKTDAKVIKNHFNDLYQHLREKVRELPQEWTFPIFQRLYQDQVEAVEKTLRKMNFSNLADKYMAQTAGFLCSELTVVALLETFLEHTNNPQDFYEHTATIRSFFRMLANSRIIAIENSNVSAEEVMELSISMIPPNSNLHLVGCQNIKGPGLTVMKLWTKLETVHIKTDFLLTGNAYQQEQSLDWLLQYGHYSPYEAIIVMRALRDRGGEGLQNLGLEEKALYDQMDKIISEYESGQEVATVQHFSFKRRILEQVDRIIDFRDSIARKKEVEKIMDLLSTGLISHLEAVRRLNDINAQQKVGRFSSREGRKK